MITNRYGVNGTGMLENWPVFAHLWPGENCDAPDDDIIDYRFDDEEDEAEQVA